MNKKITIFIIVLASILFIFSTTQIAIAANAYGFFLPLDNMSLTTHITEGFGLRNPPVAGAKPHHDGIDISWGGISGTPIRAVKSGTAFKPATATGTLGNFIAIDHGTIGGTNFTTLYAHMNATPLVSSGQSVQQGQVIGYVGNSGLSVGNGGGYHLHFEVRTGTNSNYFDRIAVNPINYLTGAVNYNPIPSLGKPTLSSSLNADNGTMTFSWSSTSNTTHYDLRIFQNGTETFYGGISGNSYDLQLPAGNYTANLASVNYNAGIWTFSDTISVNVPGKPVLSVSPNGSGENSDIYVELYEYIG